MKKFEELLINLEALYYLLDEHFSYKINMNPFSKIKLLLKGFIQECWILYDIDNLDLYLSEYQRGRTKRINGKYSLLLNNKKLLKELLSPFDVVPKDYGLIIKGKYIDVNNELRERQDFINLISKEKRLIIKPLSRGGGKEVYLIEFIDNNYQLNYQPKTVRDLNNLIDTLDNFMIEEYVQQGDYINDIFALSANTIRILTIRDPLTNEIHIPAAVQKLGNKNSMPADNWYTGGMTIPIDLETGELGVGLWSDVKNNKKIEYFNHPDTNKRIPGTIIPNWKETLQRMKEIASNLSFIHYIGWDIMVTNDSFKIIEGNSYTGVRTLQIHKPLLSDPICRRFYEYHKITKLGK